MNNRYYRVRVAMNTDRNMTIGTIIEEVFAAPDIYEKRWQGKEYYHIEKTFASEAEARAFKRSYDNY